MTRARLRHALLRIPALLLGAAAALGCARKPVPTLAPLCSGATATAHVAATIDTIRPPAGPELAAAKGSRFELRFTFAAAKAGAAAAGCPGTAGTAAFTGSLPVPIRTATAAAGMASWRIETDSVLLDLNPGARDNNVFVVLPLHGGRGHWGLSTFAGEVAGGATAFIR